MDFADLLAAFASAFQQANRLITLDLGDSHQWDGRLLPQTVDGSEAVSACYRYTVDCLSPDASLDLAPLLGQSARLAIRDQNGQDVVRAGVITQAQRLGADGGFSRYRLTIEPPLALLTHRVTSRVFQDLSVPDIVKQVLAEHQRDNPVFARLQTLTFNLSGQHGIRSYTVQYRESDLTFLTRLMHEEGLAWRFEHHDTSPPQVQLTVFDDPYSLPQASQQRVRFHRADATETEDGMTDWAQAQQIMPGKVSMTSFDYKPVSALQANEPSSLDPGPSARAAQSTLEYYEPQTLYYAGDSDQLAHYARLRQQALDAQAQTYRGSGSMRGLQAGQWFQLDDHPLHDNER
ncbi:type VI secretion system Vgr family protein, partial [Paludibacterium sp.]|uniref:type VI secretion system Vgr family protein n=1 Tax=Paludibacterium sp. TaxID=1917523 RepID=UPI0025E0FE19